MGATSQKFDQQLLTLKLSKPARQMQMESLASDKAARSSKLAGSVLIRIVDGQLAVLRNWLETLDRVCREVWQTQGETITPEFVREILAQEAMTAIEARVGVTNSHVDRTAGQTHEDPHAAQHHLAMEVSRLKAEVNNRYEIEARELEYRNAPTALPSAEMAGNAQGAAPSQLENLKRGIAGRNARIEQLERILSNPPSKIVQGVPVQVNLGSPSALRLIEEKQRHEMARDELLQELSRFQAPMKPAGGVSNAPKAFAGVRGSEWREFHDRFMLLAREEQGLGRADVITNGKALRRMEVLRAHCDYKDYRERVFVAQEVRSFYESLGVELTSEDLSKIEAKMLEWTELEKKAELKAPETGRWTYGTGAVSENFRERVRLCVVEAGRSLPDYQKGTDPEDFWLHQLYLDLLKNNSDLLFCGTKEGGMILSVCVASATFCSRLERQGLHDSETGSRGTGNLVTSGNQPEPPHIEKTDSTMAEEWRRGAEPPVITDFVNFSLPAGWTHAELIQEIATRLRWRVEPLPDHLGQVSFHRGCSVFGAGKEILDKIAAEYENLYWTEKDGALRFAVRDVPVQYSSFAPPIENRPKTIQSAESMPALSTRKAVLMPLLAKKHFSVHDWANAADVDWHTADNYLNGKTKPYQSTIGKLARALDTDVEDMPV